MQRNELDVQLLAAHSKGDRLALITLYLKASQQSANEDAKAFYLTQAHVFALDSGDPRADDLKGQLISMNRDV